MKWVELSVDSAPEFVEPLSEIFRRYGQGGVAVEENGGFNPDEGETAPVADTVTVKTYLPVDSRTEDRRNHIDLGVRLVAHLDTVSSLRQRVLEEEDWRNAWKEHFHVLHVGRRTVIVPTWREYEPRESEVVVALDPGMAFGTGHHPTTRMCLELLEELVTSGSAVLDVGCGSGILSIAAAKLGAGRVLGLDIEPVASEVATSNVRGNSVETVVRTFGGTLPHPEVSPKSYDLVVVNISARAISDLAGELVAALRPRGSIVASGLLLEKRDAVAEGLAVAGAALTRAVESGDWVSLVATKGEGS